MDYEIIMPVLSDTMENGKLIKWHVKEGNHVKKGDVIAEVESDKAIMEVQTFKNGIVKKLLAKEGEEVPVKTPIAIIDTEEMETKKEESQPIEQSPKTKVIQESKKEEVWLSPELHEHKKISQGEASPAAKVYAKEQGIDIKKLQEEGVLPKPAHRKDIEQEVLKRYFTPKALKLLQEYRIDPSFFTLDHKIESQEVMNLIYAKNIPKIVSLSQNQKGVIKTVETAAKKPVYFVFEEFNIKKYEEYKLTSIILKTVGEVMQRHPLTRAELENDHLKIYPHSNISVALARDDGLFMIVCKEIERKSLQEIDQWVRSLKTRKFTSEDFVGSTFGLSNLGMFGIKSFSAMINGNESGIAAFGALSNGVAQVTFTFDHRIINGADGARFVSDLKESFQRSEIV